MAGITVPNLSAAAAAAAAASAAADGGANSSNALYLNSFRITAAAGRLAMHVGSQPKNDVVEFCQLCLSLARGIDCAIASHDVPARTSELASLFKQICKRKCDSFAQAAVMVLMISVKCACQSGWFSEKDSEELCVMADEISSSFCSETDFKREPSGSMSIISTIMSRFFPLLKLGQIFAFLEVKPEYGTYISDFHISKSVKTTQQDKIRLLVAQIDNIETTSCLVNPPLANFLLNGKAVEKRTNVLMDTGPQMPTIVSHMLKYGTNLLQAVGQFDGNYIIAVAFMSMEPIPDSATLLDYVQPTPASVDPDSEVIEGPSRISLNCPISFKRIKTPVKGQSCKHLQCFDYHNYININLRRPSWRCPHCNQHSCFTDIRIDQDMAKVLKEVGENVTDVILSSDGSWKAIIVSDDHTDNPPAKKPNFSRDETMQPDSNGFSSSSANLLDLTEVDDANDMVGTAEIEDRKGFQTQPLMSNPTKANQSSNVDDDFWSGIYLSTLESGTLRSSSNPQIDGVTVTEAVPTSMIPTPVLTDALVQASVIQGGDSSPNSLQLQQFLNSPASNEYGWMPSITRHSINREPIAVQALPAQTPSTVPQQRPRIPNVSPTSSQATPTNMNTERQQQFSRTNSNMSQTSHVSSPTLPNNQFIGHKNPIHAQTPFRGSSGFTPEPLNTSRQGVMNQQQTPYTPNQPQGLSRPPTPSFSRSNSGNLGQTRGGVSPLNLQPMHAAQRTAQVARPVQLTRSAPPHLANSDPSRGNTSGPGPVPMDTTLEQDWRPAGRMRGSLSGRAYSEALEHYVIRPTQQAQAPRPSIPPNISPQLQALMANRFGHTSAPVNSSSNPAVSPDASAGLPQHSSGMQ